MVEFFDEALLLGLSTGRMYGCAARLEEPCLVSGMNSLREGWPNLL